MFLARHLPSQWLTGNFNFEGASPIPTSGRTWQAAYNKAVRYNNTEDNCHQGLADLGLGKTAQAQNLNPRWNLILRTWY